jgi:hypothetical protein
VYGLPASGALPGVRIKGTDAWRVDPADLKAFIDGGRTGHQPAG